MSLRRAAVRITDRGFPRVSGDEPWLKGKTETMGAFSPRERG